jgi:hypothetical protein
VEDWLILLKIYEEMKSFSQVTRFDLQGLFGINVIKEKFIPTDVQPIPVPSWLEFILESSKDNLIALRNEKSISESIIAPVLMSVQHFFADKITVFSGEPIATEELWGTCDFFITKDPKAFDPQNGYLILVEAKRNDLFSGVPQCVAEMYAAQKLNNNNEVVYGCVSTGLEWLFIKLENKIATTHPEVFTISEVPKILGIFGWIIG